MKSKKCTCVSSTKDSSIPLLIFMCGIVVLLNTTLLQKSYANISMPLYETDHSFRAVDGHVYGNVTSENGDPLPGVNIQVDGSSKGATTDSAGKFDLQLPEGRYTLRISFVGYQTHVQDITVDGADQTISVTLQESLVALNEVVIFRVHFQCPRAGQISTNPSPLIL